MAKKPEFYLQQMKDFLAEDTISVHETSLYIDVGTEMSFVCKLCQYVFETTPQSVYHSNTRCPFCFGKKRTKEIVQKKLDDLGKKITVLSDYKSSKEHMEVQCTECNYLWSSLFCNLKKNGCPACNQKVKWTTESFASNPMVSSKVVVLGEFINSHTPITSKCKDCGNIWNPHPRTLLSTKGGCPSCARSGFDPSKPGHLYYLKVYSEDRTYWKIGITNNSIAQRFHAIADREKIIPLYCQYFEDGATAQLAEKNILEMFKEYRAKDVNILKLSGNRELFTKDVLQMDHLANRGLDDWPLYHLIV